MLSESFRQIQHTFFNPDYTVGFGIAPNQRLRARGLYRRSGIAPCLEDIHRDSVVAYDYRWFSRSCQQESKQRTGGNRRGFSSAVFRPAFSDPAGGPSVSILLGLLRCVSAASSHLHLLPLLLGNEKLPGLGPLEGPHIAPLLQLVHKARGTGVAQLQAPLEHGRGRLTRLQDDLHGGGKELVLLALLGLGGGLAALIALFLDGFLDFGDYVVIVLGLAGLLNKGDHPFDLLRSDEAALDPGGLPGPQGGVEHVAPAH